MYRQLIERYSKKTTPNIINMKIKKYFFKLKDSCERGLDLVNIPYRGPSPNNLDLDICCQGHCPE